MKMLTNTFGAFFGALLIVAFPQDALAYSKYGRSCRDIGCRSDEVCVIQEDPCTAYSGDRCGRYPTCKKVSDGGCRSIVCGANKFCRTINGEPTCIDKETDNTVPIHPGPESYPVPIQRPSYPLPSRRRTPPPPPPRSSSYGGGRFTGYSRSRNTVGSRSLWNRLFDDNTTKQHQPSTRRPAYSGQSDNYYRTHTSVDSRGNRVWTFSH